MKKDLKNILKKLERIEENQMGQLQGGFASIATPVLAAIDDNTSNNCKGGVCMPSNNCRGGNCKSQ